MLNTVVKRGRGRPRKDETATIKKVGKKRGRGRPVGSKNKTKKGDVETRIERIESVVALFAEIMSGMLSKMASKKGK